MQNPWFHLSSVQIRRGRFKTNQHQCRAEEISRLAHCATQYIWDDNCLVCATIGLKQDLVHLAIALVCEITSFCRTLEVERSH